MPKSTNPDPTSAPTGSQRVAEHAPKLLAGMAALTTLAYLEDVIYIRSYFAEFGASWILDKVPTAFFFQRSMIPVLLVLFFAFLTVMDLFSVDRRDGRRAGARFTASLVMLGYGPWLLIALSLLDLGLGGAGYTTGAVAVSTLSLVTLLLMVAAGLDCLIVRLRMPDIRFDRSMIALAMAVVVLGLYLVPARLGVNVGRLDKTPSSSTLSTVYFRDDPTEYKLLFSMGDRLYVFPARYEGEDPPIDTASAATLEFIQRERAPE
jgi:hypothetical protein